MPLLSTAGAASHRGFRSYGIGSSGPIEASGGNEYLDPTDVDYMIHEFTADDTFEVTECPEGATIELLAVAGGGGGGGLSGGGAGGYIYNPEFPIGVGSWPVVIGSGGVVEGYGVDTIFGDPFTGIGAWALGGGFGYAGFSGKGGDGGSGGGGIGANTGGAALQPTASSPGYGNKGGDGAGGTSGGGGGGAGSAGSNITGGSGRTADIRNPSGVFDVLAAGGYGFGGAVLPAAQANTGNGGYAGTSGQSGIIRIRYKFQ